MKTATPQSHFVMQMNEELQKKLAARLKLSGGSDDDGVGGVGGQSAIANAEVEKRSSAPGRLTIPGAMGRFNPAAMGGVPSPFAMAGASGGGAPQLMPRQKSFGGPIRGTPSVTTSWIPFTTTTITTATFCSFLLRFFRVLLLLPLLPFACSSVILQPLTLPCILHLRPAIRVERASSRPFLQSLRAQLAGESLRRSARFPSITSLEQA